VTIRCELDVEPVLNELKQTEQNKDELIAIYQELQFKKWLSELGEDLAVSPSETPMEEFKPGNYEMHRKVLPLIQKQRHCMLSRLSWLVCHLLLKPAMRFMCLSLTGIWGRQTNWIEIGYWLN